VATTSASSAHGEAARGGGAAPPEAPHPGWLGPNDGLGGAAGASSSRALPSSRGGLRSSYRGRSTCVYDTGGAFSARLGYHALTPTSTVAGAAEGAVGTWEEELRPPNDSRGLPSPRAGRRDDGGRSSCARHPWRRVSDSCVWLRRARVLAALTRTCSPRSYRDGAPRSSYWRGPPKDGRGLSSPRAARRSSYRGRSSCAQPVARQ
jgi:hypothetical protein